MPEPRSSIPVPDPASYIPLARGSTQLGEKYATRFPTVHPRLPVTSGSSKQVVAVCWKNPNQQSSKILRGTIRATNNMTSFNNFFWSALFGGVIGSVLGASWRSRFSAIKNQGKLNVRRRKVEIEPPTWGESLSNMNTYLKFESFLK